MIIIDAPIIAVRRGDDRGVEPDADDDYAGAGAARRWSICHAPQN
ncbi:hypothetical protein [Bradyrhizobium zhanjiangense]|nr:hypothetical protein [Bradyrhizobium zhanjiangense]